MPISIDHRSVDLVIQDRGLGDQMRAVTYDVILEAVQISTRIR